MNRKTPKPLLIILFAAMLFINFSRCTKDDEIPGYCWKCQAQCGSTKSEKIVCSDADEDKFRAAHTDCSVECE